MKPQFLGGPKDGDSAATFDTATTTHEWKYSPTIHLYVRRVDGSYDYAGVKDDEEDGS